MLTAWYSLNNRNCSLCSLVNVLITAAVGAGVGMSGCTPGCVGTTKSMFPLCVMNTDGCAVSTKYPRVPHPSEQLIDDEHALRYTLTSVMYAYVGTP